MLEYVIIDREYVSMKNKIKAEIIQATGSMIEGLSLGQDQQLLLFRYLRGGHHDVEANLKDIINDVPEELRESFIREQYAEDLKSKLDLNGVEDNMLTIETVADLIAYNKMGLYEKGEITYIQSMASHLDNHSLIEQEDCTKLFNEVINEKIVELKPWQEHVKLFNQAKEVLVYFNSFIERINEKDALSEKDMEDLETYKGRAEIFLKGMENIPNILTLPAFSVSVDKVKEDMRSFIHKIEGKQNDISKKNLELELQAVVAEINYQMDIYELVGRWGRMQEPHSQEQEEYLEEQEEYSQEEDKLLAAALNAIENEELKSITPPMAAQHSSVLGSSIGSALYNSVCNPISTLRSIIEFTQGCMNRFISAVLPGREL
jgi:hypothetical protein